MCEPKTKYEKEFQETYDKALKRQSEITQITYHTSDVVYEEDFTDDDIEDEKEENQVKPEDEAVIELELGLDSKETKVNPNEGTCIYPNRGPAPVGYPGLTGRKTATVWPTKAKVIRSINYNRAIKSKIMTDLGITRKFLNYHLKRYPESMAEYRRVREIWAGVARTRPSDSEIIDALHVSKANVALAASTLGMSFSYLLSLIQISPIIKEGLGSARKYKVELTLSKQDELVDGIMVLDHDFKGMPVVYKVSPNQAAIKNVLKAEAKELGYGDSIDKNVKVTVEPITFNYIAPTNPKLLIEKHVEQIADTIDAEDAEYEESDD